jgi:murein DD-endopeptidase MepM/ murein hydrolase activator NlpD
MSDRLHIIITGETGEPRSFAVRKKAIRNTIGGLFFAAVLLTAGTFAGISFFTKNISLVTRTEHLKSRLAETSAALVEVKSLQEQLELDHELLLEGSISRLDEQSRIIREIMDDIGVTVEVEEDPDHSGGPLLAPDIEYGHQLLELTDHYLDVLRKVPVGRPTPGEISSKYGNRIDPLTNKKAFHPGIDFRGNTGDEIRATADAVVEEIGRDNVFGKYIVLSHDNGFETIFAHLHKQLVKEKETVSRGQVIGQIGSTGRSTGPHLHYVIRYQGKSIDPTKYLEVADLSLTVKN